MRKFLKITALVLQTLTLTFCGEDDQVRSREFPKLNTLEVSNITSTGATFNAEFSFRGDFEITSYGFVWSTFSQNFTLDNSEKVVVKENILEPGFSLEISSALEEGETYYVRAVVTTDEFVVYGPTKEFVSLGSDAPQIESIFPMQIFYGDTLRVRGSNFSYVKSNNLVKFDEVGGKVVEATDTTLSVLVPDLLTSTSSTLSVSVAGNISEAEEPLTFIGPEITSLSKTKVVYGDTVEIFGHHFGYKSELNSVKIGKVEVDPIATDSTRIQLVIPVTDKEFSISVTNSLGQHTESNTLTIPDPIIIQLSQDEGFYGDEIEIRGENFGYLEEIVEVYFNDQKAEIHSFSNQLISVTVPGNFENPASVRVLVNDQTTNSKPFVFTDFTISTISPIEVTWRDQVVISGSNFSTDHEENSVKIDGYEAEIISFSSNEIIAKVPDEVDSKSASIEVTRLTRTKLAATSLTMKDPVITGLSKNQFEVGETITLTGENFHPIASNNQLRLDNIPLLITSSEKTSVTFSSSISIVSNTLISEEFYGILEYSNSIGTTNSSNVQITYEGPWTKLSPPTLLKDDHYGMVTTSSENFIYLFGGHKYENQSFTFSNTLQQYNISTDEWLQISSLPADGRDHAQIFEYKNSIYIGSGQSLDYFYDFWKYDVTTETWSQLNDIPNYTGNTRPQTLITNNRIFSFFDKKIFEYTETTDTWNQLALNIPYQYYWIIGIYPESSNIKMPTIEIFNENVAQSTLHDITFNPDSESLIINQSYSPFGYSQSFLRGDADKLFLVSANQYLYTLQNGSKLVIQKPITNKIFYAEEINGILYLGFNDGSFWSYNDSK